MKPSRFLLVVLILGSALVARAAEPILPGAYPAEAVVPINDRDYGPGVKALFASAQKSIHLCMYQIRFYEKYPGSVSNQMIDLMIAARKRGVEVRVVIDSTPWKEGGQFDANNEATAKRLLQGGCEVSFDPGDIQSHQKLIVVDGKVTVVSSHNWSHYSQASNREVAVMMWGPEIAALYEEYFQARVRDSRPYKIKESDVPTTPLSLQIEPPELAKGTPALLDPEALAARLKVPAARDAWVQPANNRDYIPRTEAAFAAATRAIDVVQNYGLYYDATPTRPLKTRTDELLKREPSLTDGLLVALVAAKKRGVKARAVFDNGMSEDTGTGQRFASEDFANRLHALGIDALRDSPDATIHAKMALVDDEMVLVGSTNWSYDAVELNNECSVWVRSKTLGAHYRQWVNGVLSRSTPLLEPPLTPMPTPEKTPAAKP